MSFRSTRPRGARPGSTAGAGRVRAGFDPRAREGRDSRASARNPPPITFRSTRPRGARPSSCPTVCQLVPFRSTRPRGARLRLWGAPPTPERFRSTRPRGARLAAWDGVIGALEFRSTRPRGARPVSTPPPVARRWSFDPRAREGRDFDLCFVAGKSVKVSIHAPARGATNRLSTDHAYR